ncbi:MAG: DUF3135 domain-containing protein [Pseudomonadota bacterium]|nr:DUF3135 domain-containing protein [Pseudomonadota bacterium]
MESERTGKFDFDTWADLAKSDPQAFEARRCEEIERLIGSASAANRCRLRGLQFRIDMERRRSRTPIGGCVRLSHLMMDAFHNQFVPCIVGDIDPSKPRDLTRAPVISMDRYRDQTGRCD